MQNNTATTLKSRGKEGAHGKTFRVPISTGILSHYNAIRDSFWLFVWYVDKTTQENDGAGLILGGMPISDSRPAADIGVPVKTVRRWRKRLVDGGYITALRTPYGYCITLLKSKKWNYGPTLLGSKAVSEARDLPKREISSSKESARSGHSDLPNRPQRVPVPGIESARNGKYKEDNAVDSAVDSKGYSRHDSAQLTAASPLRTKPTGRGRTQLGTDQTETEIARAMALHRDTVSHHLADAAKSNYFVTREDAKRHCGDTVDEYAQAFAAIDYPFDLSSSVLGWEFADAVQKVVEESQDESPRPKKWELCERVLDECDKSWDSVETCGNVGLPYWPPDFDAHINRLFERERTNARK